MSLPNHYEFLQISPNAESATIQRVYRFLAVRLHPDNPDTGDADKFCLLKQAYEVLSDPSRRAEYDTACLSEATGEPPLSNSIDFMDNLQGELNRRLAVLALLYIRRRTHPDNPEVSLFEIESRMGFPRDYLDFTIWYLQKKGYISRADNAEFTLMAEGVDFVEAQRLQIPVLNKMLTSESGVTGPGATEAVMQRTEPGPIELPSAMPQNGQHHNGHAQNGQSSNGHYDRRSHKDRRRH